MKAQSQCSGSWSRVVRARCPGCRSRAALRALVLRERPCRALVVILLGEHQWWAVQRRQEGGEGDEGQRDPWIAADPARRRRGDDGG